MLLLALSDPVAEKKLEKFKFETTVSVVHSVLPIKWAKDHIKAKSKDNFRLIIPYQNLHRSPVI